MRSFSSKNITKNHSFFKADNIIVTEKLQNIENSILVNTGMLFLFTYLDL